MEIWNDKLRKKFFRYLKIESFIIIFIHLFVSYIMQFIELNYNYYYYSFLSKIFDFFEIDSSKRNYYRFFIYYLSLFYFFSYFVVRFFRAKIANDVEKTLSDFSISTKMFNNINDCVEDDEKLLLN